MPGSWPVLRERQSLPFVTLVWETSCAGAPQTFHCFDPRLFKRMLCLSLQVSGISRFCLIALPVCPICSFLGCSLQLCLCFPATMRFTPSTRLFAPSSNRLGDPHLCIPRGSCPSVTHCLFLPVHFPSAAPSPRSRQRTAPTC